MTWPRISESTFSSKISSQISWKSAQLSKMFRNNVPLSAQRFEDKVLSSEFPSAVSSLSLLKTSSLDDIFYIIFKPLSIW